VTITQLQTASTRSLCGCTGQSQGQGAVNSLCHLQGHIHYYHCCNQYDASRPTPLVHTRSACSKGMHPCLIVWFNFQGVSPCVTCCTAVCTLSYASTTENLKHCCCSIIITISAAEQQDHENKLHCPCAMCASASDPCSKLTQQRGVFHAASQR